MLMMRPTNAIEFAEWLRTAIEELEDVEATERDLSHYDYSAIVVMQAGKFARYVGAQELCERCKVTTRLSPEDGLLLSPEDGLTILGECLAWCIERMPSVDATTYETTRNANRPQLFSNGKPFLFEDEATEYLEVPNTTLRDARLRGELKGSKVGRRWTYSMANITDWQRSTLTRKDD